MQENVRRPEGASLYAFTLNASDRYQYFNHPLRMRMALIKYIEKVHWAFNSISTYKLYVEISKPEESTKGPPRIHLHGTIEFKHLGYEKFLLDKYNVLAQFGVFKLSKMNDLKVWRDYYLKDQEIMEDLLRELGLPLFINQNTTILQDGRDENGRFKFT